MGGLCTFPLRVVRLSSLRLLLRFFGGIAVTFFLELSMFALNFGLNVDCPIRIVFVLDRLAVGVCVSLVSDAVASPVQWAEALKVCFFKALFHVVGKCSASSCLFKL